MNFFALCLPKRAQHYHLGFYALLYIMIIVAFVTANRSGGNRGVFIVTIVLQTAGIATVPLALAVCHWQLRLWCDLIDGFVETASSHNLPSEWFSKEISTVTIPFWIVILALVFGLATATTYLNLGWLNSNYILVTAAATLCVAVSATMAGIALALMVTVGRVIRTIPLRFEIQLSAGAFGVLSLGNLLFRLFAIVVLTWLVYFASAVKTDAYINLAILIIGIPVFVCFVIVWFWIQFPWHSQMRVLKIKQVQRWQNYSSQLKSRNLSQLDSDTREMIVYVERELDKALSLPTWPFSVQSLVGVSIASLSPMFVTIATSGIIDQIVLYLD